MAGNMRHACRVHHMSEHGFDSRARVHMYTRVMYMGAQIEKSTHSVDLMVSYSIL